MAQIWLTACGPTGPVSSMFPDIFAAIRSVIGAFQTLGIPYHLTGVMKVQREALDMAYLRRWGSELGLTDLLDRAIRESGI